MDARGFLAAIADEPDADTSRRVYPALVRRERELLIEHGMDWARVLVDHAALEWNFRLGPPCWARFTLADFLRHGAAVLDNTLCGGWR